MRWLTPQSNINQILTAMDRGSISIASAAQFLFSGIDSLPTFKINNIDLTMLE